MRNARQISWLCFCALTLAASGTAFAQDGSYSNGSYSNDQYSSHHNPATFSDTGIYIGAGYVRAQLNNVFGHGNYSFDINHNAWQAIVGWRPVPVFAAEADYVDLGSESHGLLGGQAPYGHADARAFGLFGLGFVPIGPIDLYAKAGGARWTLSGSLTGPGNSLLALNRHGVSFAWGAGIQAHIGPVGARLGYEHFQMPDTDGARLYNLSLIFTF